MPRKFASVPKYTNAKLKKILAKINAIPREKLDFSTS